MEFLSNKVNFYYDPRRQGYDVAAWKTILGTPAIVGTNLVFNNAGAVGRHDIARGEVIMALEIPTDPTAGDDREWGLSQPNLGSFVGFKIDGEVFTAEVRDGYGNAKIEAITWNTDWTAAEVEYKVTYTPAGWYFYINGKEQAFINQLFPAGIAATTQHVANTFTDAAHGLINGEKIIFSAIVDTTGFDDRTLYYVVNSATNTFQIALEPGGDAVDLGTSDGSCNYHKYLESEARKSPMSLYVNNVNADDLELYYVHVLDAEVWSAGVTANISVTADTEFPDAAPITDNFANPTTTSVMAMSMGWDGAAWDRIPGNSVDGLKVDTELPAAAALADATANPTTALLGNAALIFNGTTWDRIRAADPAANPGNVGVLATQLHVSDNTNVQRVLAPIILGDGVNGNNMLSVGSWVWNGATWDRMPGDLTNGVKVNTGLKQLEDAGHTTGDAGVQALAVRNDTLGALAGTDKDYAPVQVNALGAVYTHLTKADGTSIDEFGGADVDDAAFTVAVDKGQVVMGVATTDTIDDGDKGALAITTDRHLKNREQYAPSSEDNTNHVIYHHLRPVAVAVDANTNANIMTVVNSDALETNKVLKASAGRMYYIRAELDSTADTGTYYLQVYNAASLPADGAVTHLIAPIKVHHTNGVTSSVDIDRALYGVYADTGIVVGWSTTQFTKTIIGSDWGVFEGHVA